MNKSFSKPINIMLCALLLFSANSNSMNKYDFGEPSLDLTVGNLAVIALKLGALAGGYVIGTGVMNYATQRFMGKLQELDPFLKAKPTEVVFPKEQKAFIPEKTDLWYWMQAIKASRTKPDSWRNLFAFYKEEEIKSPFGHRPEPGVILVGSPGAGKTVLAEEFARELGAPFIKISGSKFTTQVYVGSGVLGVDAFFDKAKKLVAQYGDVVALVDEADSLMQRTSNEDRSYDNAANNALLQKIDEMPKGLRLILATNHIQNIDKALYRAKRLKVIEINNPDEVNRYKALTLHSRQRPFYSSAYDYLLTIAGLTEDFSFAELEDIVNNASKHAEITYSDTQAEAITQEDLKHALAESLELKIRKLLASLEQLNAKWIHFGFSEENDKGKEKEKESSVNEGSLSPTASVRERLQFEKRDLEEKIAKLTGFLNLNNQTPEHYFSINETIIGEAPSIPERWWIQRFCTKFNASPYLKYPVYGVGLYGLLRYRESYLPYISQGVSKLWNAELWNKTALSIPYSVLNTFLPQPVNN